MIREFRRQLVAALRRAMAEKVLTQREVAERLEVSEQYVSRALSADSPQVHRVLFQMARLLDVDPGAVSRTSADSALAERISRAIRVLRGEA